MYWRIAQQLLSKKGMYYQQIQHHWFQEQWPTSSPTNTSKTMWWVKSQLELTEQNFAWWLFIQTLTQFNSCKNTQLHSKLWDLEMKCVSWKFTLLTRVLSHMIFTHMTPPMLEVLRFQWNGKKVYQWPLMLNQTVWLASKSRRLSTGGKVNQNYIWSCLRAHNLMCTHSKSIHQLWVELVKSQEPHPLIFWEDQKN